MRHLFTTLPLRLLLASSLAVGIATAACSSSSKSSTGGGQSLTCQNGQAGPESEACDECGQTNCSSQHTAVVSNSSCATMVSCIEACQCDANDTCLDGCINAASSDCQNLINDYADCEKMAAACASVCTTQ